MKVLLRNPRRELNVDGPMTVRALLAELDVGAESVLVIRNGATTGDTCAFCRLRRRAEADGRNPGSHSEPRRTAP